MKTKTENTTQYENPGRPRYEMKFPTGAEWTFVQLMKRNGVDTEKRLASGKDNPNYGKGENCTMLTLRKNLDFCIYAKTAKGKVSKRKGIDPNSIVVPVEGVTAEPDSASGLGRRATLYRLRAVPAKDHSAELAVAPVATVKTRKPRKANATKANVTAEVNQTIEDAKSILAEPTVSVPATTITPDAAPVAPIPDAVHNDFGDNAPVATPEVTPAPIPQTVAESVAAGATVEHIEAPASTPTVEETAVVIPAPVVTETVPA